MIKPCDAGVIYPRLGLGGQECSRHSPRRVFVLHPRLLSPDSAAELHKHTSINSHLLSRLLAL